MPAAARRLEIGLLGRLRHQASACADAGRQAQNVWSTHHGLQCNCYLSGYFAVRRLEIGLLGRLRHQASACADAGRQ